MKTNIQKLITSIVSSSYKTILSLVVILAATFYVGYAQQGVTAGSSQLLQNYLEIKNALVAGDPSAASIKSGEFAKTLMGIDTGHVKEATRMALLKHAGLISISKDLRIQRENFATLSVNMYLLAKSSKLSDTPLYYVYCPMRKAYWLSSEATIKNPYYGSSMLTCGQVKETIR
jgi:hypothetical protein